MAKNFIAGAIKRPGQLHRDLGIPQGQKIPASTLAAAAQRGGKVGQRARFAQTLSHFADGGKVTNDVSTPHQATFRRLCRGGMVRT